MNKIFREYIPGSKSTITEEQRYNRGTEVQQRYRGTTEVQRYNRGTEVQRYKCSTTMKLEALEKQDFFLFNYSFKKGKKGWKVDYFTCICLSIVEYWTTRLENSDPTTLITKQKLKFKKKDQWKYKQRNEIKNANEIMT